MNFLRLFLLVIFISFTTCNSRSAYIPISSLPGDLVESVEKRVQTGFNPGIAIEIVDKDVRDMLKFLAANLGLFESNLQSAMEETYVIRYNKSTFYEFN